jgi:hypothetical protein
MWFLVVIVVNVQGVMTIDLFQTYSRSECRKKLETTEKVLNHEKNTVQVFKAECKKVLNT